MSSASRQGPYQKASILSTRSHIKRKLKMNKVVILLFLSVVGWTKDYPILTRDQLEKAKEQGECRLLHFWAGWCPLCIEELPDLIREYEKLKKPEIWLVDLSSTFLQKNFSLPWMQKIAPEIKSYLKPDVDDKKYLKGIDPEWGERLPRLLLIHNGKIRWAHTGKVHLEKVKEAASQFCK
jgi:thiol-disulfide isomerase/thioredoxin